MVFMTILLTLTSLRCCSVSIGDTKPCAARFLNLLCAPAGTTPMFPGPEALQLYMIHPLKSLVNHRIAGTRPVHFVVSQPHQSPDAAAKQDPVAPCNKPLPQAPKPAIHPRLQTSALSRVAVLPYDQSLKAAVHPHGYCTSNLRFRPNGREVGAGGPSGPSLRGTHATPPSPFEPQRRTYRRHWSRCWQKLGCGFNTQ